MKRTTGTDAEILRGFNYGLFVSLPVWVAILWTLT